MAQNRIFKFRDIDQATLTLNGAVFGVEFQKSVSRAGSPCIAGLVGTKLRFTQPAAFEVTFTSGSSTDDPTTLTYGDIKTQIEGGSALIRVASWQGTLVLIEKTPANGVTVTSPSSGSDARGLLGFDTNGDTVGKIYSPASISVTPPCWVWADTNNENMHVVYAWE